MSCSELEVGTHAIICIKKFSLFQEPLLKSHRPPAIHQRHVLNEQAKEQQVYHKILSYYIILIMFVLFIFP